MIIFWKPFLTSVQGARRIFLLDHPPYFAVNRTLTRAGFGLGIWDLGNDPTSEIEHDRATLARSIHERTFVRKSPRALAFQFLAYQSRAWQKSLNLSYSVLLLFAVLDENFLKFNPWETESLLSRKISLVKQAPYCILHSWQRSLFAHGGKKKYLQGKSRTTRYVLRQTTSLFSFGSEFVL